MRGSAFGSNKGGCRIAAGMVIVLFGAAEKAFTVCGEAVQRVRSVGLPIIVEAGRPCRTSPRARDWPK